MYLQPQYSVSVWEARHHDKLSVALVILHTGTTVWLKLKTTWPRQYIGQQNIMKVSASVDFTSPAAFIKTAYKYPVNLINQGLSKNSGLW